MDLWQNVKPEDDEEENEENQEEALESAVAVDSSVDSKKSLMIESAANGLLHTVVSEYFL